MDRLSGLPDELIGHILWFLPTKSFVQTSVLAKQWRFLWTRFPALGFTVNEDSSKSTNRTLIYDELNSWIETSVFNARNIVIRLNQQLALPRRLFTTSNTLVDLCIIDSGDIHSEDVAYNFPALKRLRLVNVGYSSKYSLDDLVSGCPVLEELVVDGMKLNLSLPVKKSLPLNLYSMLSRTATIRYLRVRACHQTPFIASWHLRPSLTEADIDLGVQDACIQSSSYSYSSLLLRVFFVGLRYVKRLTLSCRLKEAQAAPIDWSRFRPLGFCNLTQLNLRADWCFITMFLLSSNNLRVLTIHHTVDQSTQRWTEPLQNKYTSKVRLMDHLETINLVDFEWSTNQEFEMVEYMLRKAKVLKTMGLIYTTAPRYDDSDFWNHKVEARNKLASFEMLSSTCSVRLRLLS